WRLQDSLPPGKLFRLGAARQTPIRRTPLPVILLALAEEILDPRLCIGGLDLRFGIRPVPYACQIRLPVGRARRRCCEVRLAFRRTRNAGSLPIQPLGLRRNRPDDQNERREEQPHMLTRVTARAGTCTVQ